MTKKQLFKQSTDNLFEMLECLSRCNNLLYNYRHVIDEETNKVVILINKQMNDISKVLYEREEMNAN
jgi:hypothetical protein